MLFYLLRRQKVLYSHNHVHPCTHKFTHYRQPRCRTLGLTYFNGIHVLMWNNKNKTEGSLKFLTFPNTNIVLNLKVWWNAVKRYKTIFSFNLFLILTYMIHSMALIFIYVRNPTLFILPSSTRNSLFFIGILMPIKTLYLKIDNYDFVWGRRDPVWKLVLYYLWNECRTCNLFLH